MKWSDVESHEVEIAEFTLPGVFALFGTLYLLLAILAG